jgi:hypothetical protein
MPHVLSESLSPPAAGSLSSRRRIYSLVASFSVVTDFERIPLAYMPEPSSFN